MHKGDSATPHSRAGWHGAVKDGAKIVTSASSTSISTSTSKGDSTSTSMPPTATTMSTVTTKTSSSPSTTANSLSSTTSLASSDEIVHSKRPSTGAIAGIVLGVLAILILIGLAILFVRRRNRKAYHSDYRDGHTLKARNIFYVFGKQDQTQRPISQLRSQLLAQKREEKRANFIWSSKKPIDKTTISSPTGSLTSTQMHEVSPSNRPAPRPAELASQLSTANSQRSLGGLDEPPPLFYQDKQHSVVRELPASSMQPTEAPERISRNPALYPRL